MTKIQAEIKELLQVFEQALDITLPNIQHIAQSQALFLLILQRILPEYNGFYKQIREDNKVSLEDKIDAIINFIEEEIIHQEIQINAQDIVQNNQTQILAFLKILFQITNSLFGEEEQQEEENQDDLQNINQKQGYQATRKVVEDLPQGLSYVPPKQLNYPNKQQQMLLLTNKEREQQTKKIVKQIIESSQKIKQQLKPVVKQMKSPSKYSNKISQLDSYPLKPVFSSLPIKQKKQKFVKNKKTKTILKQKNLQSQRQRLNDILVTQKLATLANLSSQILNLQKQRLIEEKKQFIKQKVSESRFVNSNLQNLNNIFENQIKQIKLKRKENLIKKQKNQEQRQLIMKIINKEAKKQKLKDYERLQKQWNKQMKKIKI